jgi:hypothetical protein
MKRKTSWRATQLQSNAVVRAVQPHDAVKLESLEDFRENKSCDCIWLLKKRDSGVTVSREQQTFLFSLDDAWTPACFQQGQHQQLYDHLKVSGMVRVLEHCGASLALTD